MRVSLAGVASNAVDVIGRLIEAVQQSNPDHADNIIGVLNPGDSIFMLKELAKHARETAKGEHTIQEFAEHYCITESKPKGA
jgi:hypothetical protein